MFTIEARTKDGAPRHRGGDRFEVNITGPEVNLGVLVVCLIWLMQGPVENVVVDDLSTGNPPHPGKYRVFYTLPGKGKYVIKATLNGKDIKGSPWRQKL